LVKQQAPDMYTMIGEAGAITAEQILLAKIQNVLDDYVDACKMAS
jgi:tagatose-1,6-bisphosphate aldolase non-catalytic subunit AgaZ/GatZ